MSERKGGGRRSRGDEGNVRRWSMVNGRTGEKGVGRKGFVKEKEENKKNEWRGGSDSPFHGTDSSLFQFHRQTHPWGKTPGLIRAYGGGTGKSNQ